jgi:hypothetical protein
MALFPTTGLDYPGPPAFRPRSWLDYLSRGPVDVPPYTPPIADPAGAGPASPYPVRQTAAPPSFGFLRQPFKGGNLFGTLATLLGAGAIASHPAEGLAGLFTGLLSARNTRQGMLDRQYADDVTAYKADQAERLAEQKAALDREKLEELAGYHKGTLESRNRGIDAANERASQGLFGRLVAIDPQAAPSLWTGLGLSGPAPAFSPGIAGTGARTAADIANTNSLMNYRNAFMAPNLAARTRGQENENAVTGDPAYIASKAKAPGIENNARYEGMLNTRNLRSVRQQMLPGDLKEQQATINYLNNVRTPLGLEGITEQRIRNRFLPEQLQTDIDATRTRTNVARTGIGRAAKTGSEATMATMIDDVEHRFGVHVPANNIGSTAPIHAGTHADGLAFDIIGPRAKEAVAYIKQAYGARVDPNTTGYRATAGKYSSEPHGHIRVRAGMDKPKAAPKAANPWSGIPSGFREDALSLGITPNAPPREVQKLITKWQREGAVRRNGYTKKLQFSENAQHSGLGALLHGRGGGETQQAATAQQELDAFNAQWDTKAKAAPRLGKTGVSTVDALFD